MTRKLKPSKLGVDNEQERLITEMDKRLSVIKRAAFDARCRLSNYEVDIDDLLDNIQQYGALLRFDARELKRIYEEQERARLAIALHVATT